MSEQTNYTFLPWLRQGIANQISGHSGLRATIAIDLNLSGDKVDGGSETRPPIQKDIEIYGPGDVIGIDPQAIIKHEPRNWITNFEPNYLPYVEFYDEDFPWRYSPMSPAGPGGHRLQPWIALVVLKEEEFKDGKNIKDRPLSYITLNGASLPPSDQLWAWAHVHVNKNIIGTDIASNNAANIESKMGTLLRNDPDMAYSRILCPRKLEENVAYHAFLVPAFETGRLAGLGRDPADAPSHDASAWSDSVTPPELPYYFRWYFRTGMVGDFEYLVRLLKPKPVDSRVGLRDMDVQNPGANIKGILDAPGAPDNEKLDGILKLGGALKIPDIAYTSEEFAIIQKYRGWATLAQPYPHPFQSDLASFINLTDSYEQKPAQQANSESNIEEVQEAADPQTEYDIKQNPDPLITAPLYGRWHSLTQRLLKERDGTDAAPNDNWVHDLNLDPRWRVAAGFGTKVVQENQENYMKAAWDQVGEVLESNKRIREAQLAAKTGWVWYTAHIKPLKESFASKWLVLSAPLHLRVLNQGVTVYHQVLQSRVPGAILAPAVRKRLSPRGRLAKRLPFNGAATLDNLIPRINEGEVSAAPPRVTPDANTLDDLAEDLKPQGVPGFVLDLVKQYPWLKWILLLIALLIIVLLLLFSPGTGILSAGMALAAGLVFLYFQFNQIGKRIEQAESVLEENQTPEAVDAMPHSPDFRISEPGDNFTPTIGGTVDSEEAKRFKQALKDTHTIIQVSREQGIQPPKPALDIAAVSNAVFDKLDPQITVPNWVWGSVLIPGRIKDQLDGGFVEAMAYPEFDLPMYKPLTEYSAELFLPNINFISENSISLLETNQKFIESYMVGLNHEFARELLWREYPTDQRGSYFRQFWEPQSYHDTEGLSAEELKEKLKDIPPIHKWLKHSDLGDHDHREVPGESGEEVVLVIRGELLKRYPNAVIYAHRAVWRDDTEDGNPILDPDSGQTIDLTKERDLRPLTPEEEANPPRTFIKTPLYEAKVDPDIYFFGFDLTACEALGGPGEEDTPMNEKCVQEGIAWNDPGWFFVIKERPGEIALGLDVPQEDDSLDDVKVWNDLSWNHVTPPVTGGGFLQINNATQAIELKPLSLPDEVEKETQKQEDENIHWNKDMNSADLAYVLYQVPVLVAVHASEMLPKT